MKATLMSGEKGFGGWFYSVFVENAAILSVLTHKIYGFDPHFRNLDVDFKQAIVPGGYFLQVEFVV